MAQTEYPIGTPGIPWGAAEKAAWLLAQRKQRSYSEDVLSRIHALGSRYHIHQYGVLPYAAQVGQDYPLFAVHSKQWSEDRPTVLITGGVHGYETSGVMGALAFLEGEAEHYQTFFNLLVLPCISPWGYETINRWNPAAVDPNRSFTAEAPAPEAQFAMAYVAEHAPALAMHLDLHETTDTDNSEFRPALAAREGTVNTNWNIPDGFYLVGDAERPTPDFQRAVLQSVAAVTHIAAADENDQLIGVPLAQEGLIYYPAKQAGLCMGLSDAPYVSTTEVYPDSAHATPEACIAAQVAAIVGGLEYLKGVRESGLLG